MGSLSSSPKAPTQPQVVFVPTPTPTVATIQDTEAEQAQESEALASASRKKSILSRNRGRFGTIATSLQGLFLGDNSTGGRKTLLGE